jgi:hypothetical protein
MSDTERISIAYQRAFARPPLPAESERTLRYLAAYQRSLAATQPEEGKRALLTWQSLCQILFASNEFIYIN